MTPEEFYDIAHSAPRERAIRYLTEALKNHTLIAIYEARKAEQPAPTETASQGTFAVGLAAIDTLAERTGRLMRGATETAPKRDCPGSPCWHCGSTEHDTAALAAVSRMHVRCRHALRHVLEQDRARGRPSQTGDRLWPFRRHFRMVTP
jgi:hypothetical protein